MRKKIPFGGFVLVGCFFLGGLLGCVVTSMTEQSGQVALEEYLLAYFSQLVEGGIELKFLSTAWAAIKVPLAAFLLGFTFLGVIGLPILFGLQGFLFTFSVSALGKLFGMEGMLPAFFLFCLPALVWVPVLFLLGLQSFQASLAQISKMFLGGKSGDRVYPTGYFRRVMLCFGGVAFLVLLEYFVLPSLLVASVSAVMN